MPIESIAELAEHGVAFAVIVMLFAERWYVSSQQAKKDAKNLALLEKLYEQVSWEKEALQTLTEIREAVRNGK